MVLAGRNIKDHLISITLSWQGHPPLDQFPQSPVFKHFYFRPSWEYSLPKFYIE